MQRAKRSLILLLIVAAFYGISQFKMFSSEEEIIVHQIEDIVALAEFEEPLKLGQIGQRLNELREHFMIDVVIRGIDGEKSFESLGWKNIQQYALIGTRLFKRTKATLDFSQVKVDGNRARVELTLYGQGLDSADQEFSEKILTTLLFVIEEKRWYIQEVEVERATP